MHTSPKTTKDIKIPKDPLERVIGQDRAVKIAKLAAVQRRHLLLVGPPEVTDKKQEMSIADQRKAILKYAEEHGYVIVRWYTDDGIKLPWVPRQGDLEVIRKNGERIRAFFD